MQYTHYKCLLEHTSPSEILVHEKSKRFILFELGFNPLTLLVANHSDFLQALKRFTLQTYFMEQALLFSEYFTEGTKKKLRDEIQIRREMSLQVERLTEDNFKVFIVQPKFYGHLLDLLGDCGISRVNAAKYLN